MCGIVCGMNSCLVGIYISEISPKYISGKLGSVLQNTVNVGISLSFIIGLFYQDKQIN